MKITLTQEGLNLRKDLRMNSLTDTRKSIPYEIINKSAKFTSNRFNNNTTSSFPKIKPMREVSVKAPRIRISKDFETRYHSSNASSIGHFGISELIQERSDINSLASSLHDRNIFVRNRLSGIIDKAKNQDEVAKIELKFRKLAEKYELQMKERENIYTKIQHKKIADEANITEKIEKFIYNFGDMTKKFEKQLLVDTRKVRKKVRVQNFYQHRYCRFWNDSKLQKLTAPRFITRKYSEIMQNIKCNNL